MTETCKIFIVRGDAGGYCMAEEVAYKGICLEHSALVCRLFSPKKARMIHILVQAGYFVSIEEEKVQWYVGDEMPAPDTIDVWAGPDPDSPEPPLFTLDVELIDAVIPVLASWDVDKDEPVYGTRTIQVPKAWVADLLREEKKS